MTRLVQVVPHLQLGGMQRMAMLLDEHLPSEGVTSTMIDLQSLREQRSTPAVWRWLIQRWRVEHPDAVLAHSALAAAFVLTAARFARVERRLIVVHASRQLLGPLKTAVVAMLAVTRTATDVVVCGNAALASFSPWLPRLARRAVAIPNAIPEVGERVDDRHRLEASATGEPSALPLRVLVAGRLVPDKRVDVAIRAVAGSSARLTVCGDGPLLEGLRALAEATGAEVTFAGTTPSEEMAEQYRRHDVLVFPSELEGLPLVLLEAASHGLAVIAADRPFNHEVLGEAAWYCASDDPAVWRVGLNALGADESERRRLATSARERTALFDLTTMVRRYADLMSDRR